MARRKVYLGSFGPYFYDDEVPIVDPDGDFVGYNRSGILTDGPVIYSGGGSTGGVSGTYTVVSDIRNNSGTIEKKTRTITIVRGHITSVSAESAWTAI